MRAHPGRRRAAGPRCRAPASSCGSNNSAGLTAQLPPASRRTGTALSSPPRSPRVWRAPPWPQTRAEPSAGILQEPWCKLVPRCVASRAGFRLRSPYTVFCFAVPLHDTLPRRAAPGPRGCPYLCLLLVQGGCSNLRGHSLMGKYKHPRDVLARVELEQAHVESV